MARKNLKKSNVKKTMPFPFNAAPDASLPKAKIMPKTAKPAQEPRPRTGIQANSNFAKAMASRKGK